MDSIKPDGKVGRKKWVARLVDRNGILVRTFHIDWTMPPSEVPGFVLFEKGEYQIEAPRLLKVKQLFTRGRMIRCDERITILEYTLQQSLGRG